MSVEPRVDQARARVIRAADAKVQPLYPATRVLKPEVVAAESALAEASAARDAAELEARRITAEAREAAERVMREAQLAAHEVLQRARVEGESRGVEGFAQALRALEQRCERLDTQSALEARRLAVRYARAILDVEFSVCPERVIDLVESLLRRSGERQDVHVRLHPSDAGRVRDALDRLHERSGGALRIRIVEDDRLGPHDVQLDTPSGRFDGSVEAQLRPLLERLDALGRGEVRA